MSETLTGLDTNPAYVSVVYSEHMQYKVRVKVLATSPSAYVPVTVSRAVETTARLPLSKGHQYQIL